mmetsp:Transcript_1723/g.3766  ORF Transcript_1723/g.3766 Transcript_1723/m.3766 type:complete len:95 (-) Transcript_1723:123-407(-)
MQVFAASFWPTLLPLGPGCEISCFGFHNFHPRFGHGEGLSCVPERAISRTSMNEAWTCLRMFPHSLARAASVSESKLEEDKDNYQGPAASAEAK